MQEESAFFSNISLLQLIEAMFLALLHRFSTFLLGPDPDADPTDTAVIAKDMEAHPWRPRGGGLVEVVGANAMGKSFVLHLLLAHITGKLGQTLAYVDCDGSFQPKVASDLGANSDLFAVFQPKSLGESLAMLELLAKQPVPNIMLDSYTQLCVWTATQKTGLLHTHLLRIVRDVKKAGHCLYLTHQNQNGAQSISPYAQMSIKIKRPLNPSLPSPKTAQQALDSEALKADFHGAD